ncbi:MAG: mechanosensitive ion channel family protein [Beutenbergiaceae bacterium]
MLSSASSILSKLTGVPLRILIIVVAASVLTLLLRLLVARVIRRLAALPHQRLELTSNAKIVIGSAGPRTAQRFRTFRSVINSTLTVLVWTIAVIMVLAELGIAVGPLLASAGLFGVAVAFGAQSLVRDVISGLFMLIEDQFGVGDRIEIGATGNILCSGTVEQVELRVTTLRDDDGRVWHMRNGEILRVANHSQGWSLAIAQVQVVPSTDLAIAKAALVEATDQLRQGNFADAILDDADVLVEDVTATAVSLRWSVRTTAGTEWDVASAMRTQILPVLRERNIELAG